eukprot:259999-Alexandrium_andersonii.AAC.1
MAARARAVARVARASGPGAQPWSQGWSTPANQHPRGPGTPRPPAGGPEPRPGASAFSALARPIGRAVSQRPSARPGGKRAAQTSPMPGPT